MNVFVLCTGRCGSTTFARACRHINNFTSGHETRASMIGDARFAYPDNHIDVDHYLSWFLGRLDEAYGQEAYYVHLTRDPAACAESWAKKQPYYMGSPATAFRSAFLRMTRQYSFLDTCREFVDTANANIRAFLKDKPNQMDFALETATADWPVFWNWIGAEGNYDTSLAEWIVQHNPSLPRWHDKVQNVRDRVHKAFWSVAIR